MLGTVFSFDSVVLMIPPSPFVLNYLSGVSSAGHVLDLACGKGRHTRVCLERGFEVTAVDVDLRGLDDLKEASRLHLVEADLENAPWPLGEATFDAVIVANYLWRPLFPQIRNAVAPGGFLLYETFAAGNEQYGKPSNPDFLLQEGELEAVFAEGFECLSFEQVVEHVPVSAVRQRLAARKQRP